jgi:hypothetical protein
MICRGKLTLTSIKTFSYGTAKEYTFGAQYDTNIEEDKRFTKYSPSGTFVYVIDNPALDGAFELGKSYYIDFQEIPE